MTAKPMAIASATGQLSSARAKPAADQHRSQIKGIAGVGA